MCVRNYIFITVLTFFFFFGCSQKLTIEEYQGNIEHSVTELPKDTTEQNNHNNNYISESNGTLSLNQALALTLMHNIDLKIYSLETRAAQARQLQAGLMPNPEIEVEMENIGGSGELSAFDGAETTIQLSQLIELGDKLQKRKNVAAFASELSDIDFRNEKIRIFSEVTKAFISVLQAQERLQLSDELLKISNESYETVGKIVDSGKESPLERTRASVALANIKTYQEEAQRNLDFAQKKLTSYWNQEEADFEQVSGDIYIIESLPELNILEEQLKSNPEYIRWETEVQKSKANLDLEKSKSTSDISVGAGYRRFNETDDNAFVLGFSIPLQFFDRNQGAREEAIYNLAKSKQQQQAALLKLKNELSERYQDYINAYNLANSMKNEIIPAAKEMYKASNTAYKEGKVDYLNVLDAQRTLFDLQNEYIETLTAYHIAKTDIERLTGMKSEKVLTSESEQ